MNHIINSIDYIQLAIAKHEFHKKTPNIQIELDLSSQTLDVLDKEERKVAIKNLLHLYRNYITKLILKFHGDEQFLLEAEFSCQNLKGISVDSNSSQRVYGSAIHTKEAAEIFEKLLTKYMCQLSMLETRGIWNVYNERMMKCQNNSVPVLNSLVLNHNLINMATPFVQFFGEHITSLEFFKIHGDETSGLRGYLPNLKHVHLTVEYCAPFVIANTNGRNLVSLTFHDEGDGYNSAAAMNSIKTNMPLFPKLKLLEMNNPKILKDVLKNSFNTLEYLYVPNQDRDNPWTKICPTRTLPALKDLCVEGVKRWSISMIKKNCSTLECLICYGYISLEEFQERENALFEEIRGFDHAMFNLNVSFQSDEYCWSYLTMLNCNFPKMELLMLPGCTNQTLVNILASRCPPNVKVITDKMEVGKVLKARIKRQYPYPRYADIINKQMAETLGIY